MRLFSQVLAEAVAQVNLTSAILRYAHVLMLQNTQTALPNGRGAGFERLARCLLMWHDRMERIPSPLLTISWPCCWRAAARGHRLLSCARRQGADPHDAPSRVHIRDRSVCSSRRMASTACGKPSTDRLIAVLARAPKAPSHSVRNRWPAGQADTAKRNDSIKRLFISPPSLKRKETTRNSRPWSPRCGEKQFNVCAGQLASI